MQARRLFLATDRGVAVVTERDGAWVESGRRIEEHAITSIVRFGSTLLAGSRTGAFLSSDDGKTWSPISGLIAGQYIRWLDEQSMGDERWLYAGLEPASIFMSTDSGINWRECPDVPQLRNRYGWYLPYSDGAGCVRGFALAGERAYAAVEVGGVLRTDDYGETWVMARGSSGKPVDTPSIPSNMVHPDVHSIYVHPTSSELVCVPTGGGFYLSDDGGGHWKRVHDGYCRACWWDPQDTQHILLGPAEGVDRNGRILESRDWGKSWQDASSGLDVPWPRHMVERFVPDGSNLYAVLSNGEVITTKQEQIRWEAIPVESRVSALVPA